MGIGHFTCRLPRVNRVTLFLFTSAAEKEGAFFTGQMRTLCVYNGGFRD